jgi:polysaccharide biosynthesis/export protein
MRLAFLFVLIASLACGNKHYDNINYADYKRPPNEIVLGVGDVLEINVWEQRDLSSDTTVRPDGTITMPLVGDLKAQGKTPSALREEIKVALANYIKLAAGNEVAVKVKAYNSYRFTVNGEVGRPGVYTNPDYIRVADAIALAGGPTRFAKRTDIRILRANERGQQIAIPIDFDLVASGRRPDMNVWVHANDVIWVP